MAGKNVQFPGGTGAAEDATIGLARQVRVDTTNFGLRLHDGIKPGGYKIPNEERVQQLIASGGDSSVTVVGVQYVTSLAELQDIVPKPNALVVLAASGLEDMFLWRVGVNDGSGVSSNVSGWWQRLDSRLGFYVRLWRAGIINMQFNGAAPAVNQDITAWADNGTIKLWNGTAYVTATPVLFARLMSEVGNYDAAIVLPDQLAEILVASTDLNLETKTGWKKSSAADANAPSATVSPVFTLYQSTNTAIQIFYVQGSADGSQWIRHKAAGTWGGWIFIPGKLASRLEAIPAAVTDANTALDSGWYTVAAAGSNIPVAADGVLQTIRRTSTAAIQYYTPVGSDFKYMRRYISSVWQAWVQVFPANASLATGSLPRANLAITTISQAEAEAGSATTDRIFTAERVKQAIQIWWATAANFLANAANKVLTANAVWSAAAEVGLTDAATIAVDMSTFINANVTLAGNRTLGQPSSTKVGQSGVIRIVQDATGSRTLAYHADWEFAGGTAPVLSTAANSQDLLFYQVLAANRIYGMLQKGVV